MRLYAATFDNQSLTTANGDYDLFELQPGDDHPIKLHSLEVGFTAAEGDALEDFVRIAVIRGHTTGGSGGSSITNANMPRLDPQLGDPNLAASLEYANSTIASSGTTQTLWATTFNIRAGLEKIWVPELRPVANQGNTSLVVRMLSTLDANDSCSATLVFEEL